MATTVRWWCRTRSTAAPRALWTRRARRRETRRRAGRRRTGRAARDDVPRAVSGEGDDVEFRRVGCVLRWEPRDGRATEDVVFDAHDGESTPSTVER